METLQVLVLTLCGNIDTVDIDKKKKKLHKITVIM